MEDKEEEIQNNTSKYDLIEVKTNKGVDTFKLTRNFTLDLNDKQKII